MLTLITNLLSFLMGGLPKLLEFFQDRADKKHELELARMQTERELEMRKAGFEAQARVEEIKTEQVSIQAEAEMEKAISEGIKSAHEHDKAILAKASPWVANLNGLVRPAVTFIFVLELVGINENSSRLHAGQNFRDGQLHIRIELFQVPFAHLWQEQRS